MNENICHVLSFTAWFDDVYESTETFAGVFDNREVIKELLGRAEELNWVQESPVWETALVNDGRDRWEIFTCERNRFYPPDKNYAAEFRAGKS